MPGGGGGGQAVGGGVGVGVGDEAGEAAAAGSVGGEGGVGVAVESVEEEADADLRPIDSDMPATRIYRRLGYVSSIRLWPLRRLRQACACGKRRFPTVKALYGRVPGMYRAK